MKYTTAGAFRAALEDRLRASAASQGQGWLVRQRKLMAFDRLMARLLVVAPGQWVLKGAVALDLRFGHRARTTRDLDLALQESEEVATIALQLAQTTNLGDFFVFETQRTELLNVVTEGAAIRYRVRSELAGRLFEQFTLDIGFSDPINLPLDLLRGPDFFRFAGIAPIDIPTLPLEQHVAEKLHAYTRTYADVRRSSRVKDLVDLVLIQSTASFEAGVLRASIGRTFASRGNQSIPTAISPPPGDWTSAYETLAREIELEPDLQAGYELAAAFLDPILIGSAPDDTRWNPTNGIWQPTRVPKSH